MLWTKEIHVSFAKQFNDFILHTKKGDPIFPQELCHFTCPCIPRAKLIRLSITNGLQHKTCLFLHWRKWQWHSMLFYSQTRTLLIHNLSAMIFFLSFGIDSFYIFNITYNLRCLQVNQQMNKPLLFNMNLNRKRPASTLYTQEMSIQKNCKALHSNSRIYRIANVEYSKSTKSLPSVKMPIRSDSVPVKGYFNFRASNSAMLNDLTALASQLQ